MRDDSHNGAVVEGDENASMPSPSDARLHLEEPGQECAEAHDAGRAIDELEKGDMHLKITEPAITAFQPGPLSEKERFIDAMERGLTTTASASAKVARTSTAGERRPSIKASAASADPGTFQGGFIAGGEYAAEQAERARRQQEFKTQLEMQIQEKKRLKQQAAEW